MFNVGSSVFYNTPCKFTSINFAVSEFYRLPFHDTLTADDFQPQTRMSVPVQDVQSDEPGHDGLVQIAMLQRVSVRVTDEDLLKFMIMRF
jgi:hypothetical protein